MSATTVVLFLIAASVALASFFTVAAYAITTQPARRGKSPLPHVTSRVARYLAGTADVGNALVHALLVIYIKCHENETSEF